MEARKFDIYFPFTGNVGYFPVCNWLGVATVFIKLRVSIVTKRWDEEVRDAYLGSHVGWNNDQSLWSGPCWGRLMYEWQWEEGLGRCKFYGHGSGIRSKWKNRQRCLLVASNQRCQAYWSDWTRCNTQRHQSGSSKAGNNVAFGHWFSMCTSVVFWHNDWEGTYKHEGG